METTMEPTPIAYSVTELAVRTSLSRQTVYAEIEAGRLQARRIRGRIVIPAAAVEDWLALRD